MNKRISLNLLLIISLLGLFTSCSDDKEKAGVPSIDKVIKTDWSETLESAALTDWVTVLGDNFIDVQSVLVNNIAIELKDTYMKKTEITLQIPRAIPDVATNKIEVVTATGKIEHDFVIKFPPLKFFGVSNEFAAVGEVVAITGENFDLYKIDDKSKVNFGDKVADVTKVEGNTLYTTVPADVPVASRLTFKDITGTTVAIPGLYKDNRDYMVMSFEKGGFWTNTDKVEGPNESSINGKYFHFVGNTTYNYMIHMVKEKEPDFQVYKDAKNWQLKFEILTNEPFTTSHLTFSFAAVPSNVKYAWKPEEPFHTEGKWRTVAIDLNRWDFSATTQVNTSMYIDLVAGPAEAQDFFLDNIRIVPKN